MKSIHARFRSGNTFYGCILYLIVFVLLPGMVSEILAANLTRVSVLEKVQIDAENILLGKIAEIESSDPILNQKLNGVVIGKAPLPGNSLAITKSIIKLRLKQNGIDAARLLLNMPAKVVVTRSFITISQEKIKALVSDYILNNFLSLRKDARIKNIKVASGLRVPTGRISYKVSPPRKRNLLGKVPVSVTFSVDDKLYKRVWATVTIEEFATVVVTKKPLGRYKPITEDDIELQKLDLAKLPSNAITDPNAVLGKRTRRAIGTRTVLSSNMVELPPLVKRGDVVVIVAESDGLKITTLGQVKKKGRLGERIPVINFDTKKILYAQVLDSNTVKVEF